MEIIRLSTEIIKLERKTPEQIIVEALAGTRKVFVREISVRRGHVGITIMAGESPVVAFDAQDEIGETFSYKFAAPMYVDLARMHYKAETDAHVVMIVEYPHDL